MEDDRYERSELATSVVPVIDADDRFRTLELSGTVFLIDEKTGVSYPIGAHGRRILALLGEGFSVDDAASMLARETGDDAVVVLKDTHRLLANLVDIGIIVDRRT